MIAAVDGRRDDQSLYNPDALLEVWCCCTTCLPLTVPCIVIACSEENYFFDRSVSCCLVTAGIAAIGMVYNQVVKGHRE